MSGLSAENPTTPHSGSALVVVWPLGMALAEVRILTPLYENKKEARQIRSMANE